MDNKNVNIQTVRPDGALRSGDFSLLPVNPQAPIITSHPLRNFAQLTWTTPTANGKERAKSVQPINDTYVIRKNTAVSWTLYATDPSNVNNINDTSNLTFTWKRDDNLLYSFNRLNQGKGTSTIAYTENESVEEITGKYVCEVSNEFGVTSTVPFTLRVIDLDNNNLLYKNLVLNGNGEGGNSEWTDPTGKIVSSFTEKSSTQNNQNTLSLHKDYPIHRQSDYVKAFPFKFGFQNSYNLFYSSYIQWDTIEPNLNDVRIPFNQIKPLPTQFQWISTSVRSNTIANEDINEAGSPQSFFPGPNYIDNYNKNQIASSQYGSIPLKDEMNVGGRSLTYFTRDFISFGEKEVVNLKQSIDVSEAANLIDGQVGGVDYITAQVFAYAGSALSRMTIRYTEKGQSVERPWLVHDSETYRRWLTENTSKTRQAENAIIPDRGTPIEIIPIADDSVNLRLRFLDELDSELGAEIIKGPDAVDLWAVKEKVDFPLTLFPLFAFFKPNDNPITVFNQKYTSTSALKGLFYHSPDRIRQPLSNENRTSLVNSLTDRNAKFIADRWGEYYEETRRVMYGDLWEKDEFWTQKIFPVLQKMAAPDKGASAFFGIGKSINIPSQARSIVVEVLFKNTSPARVDSNAEGKGWDSSQIYNSLFEVKPTLTPDKAPNPLYEYGEPRCGITKIKVQLIPNNNTTSERHTTYSLPPKANTVAGIARDRVYKNVHDTSEPGLFVYPFIQPQPLADKPTPIKSSSELVKLIDEQRNAQAQGYVDINSIQPADETATTPAEDRQFELDSSINQEGIDQADRELGLSDD